MLVLESNPRFGHSELIMISSSTFHSINIYILIPDVKISSFETEDIMQESPLFQHSHLQRS